MSSTILITGAAGFIGSSLVSKLIKENTIIAVDDFNGYYNPDWKEENITKYLTNSNFQLYKIDIRKLSDLKKITKVYKIDKIIHLAARAGVRPSMEDPLLYESVNVQGTLNLLELARQYKIPQFIFASSSSVYGNQTKVPFAETDPVNEPISPYAATKKAGEMFCYTYAKLYGIKTTCLRFFTVYGPCGRPDMAPYLFTKALLAGEEIKKFGDGNSKRDYTYIDDIVEGVVQATKTPFDFEIINLGNNNPLSLNEFIATIEKITGLKAQIKELPKQAGDVDQTYATIEKAKKLLHWEPKTKFEDGMKKFIEWYKKERL